MTIHKLTAGDGYTYLTRHIAGGDVDRERGQDAADYYTADGNPPGRWLGKGVRLLGVDPTVVTETQMRALFGLGLHPDADRMIADYQAAHITAGMTEQQIAAVTVAARRHAALGRQFPVYQALDPYEQRVARRLAVIAADMHRPPTHAEIGKIRREEATRQRAAVAGYDAVLAPVKSAALLLLDEREWVRRALREAHEEARDAAIAMLEQHAAYTRTGKAGIAQIETHGLIAVAFDHYDSRHGDPNLHTHLVLANKIQGVDGKWRSLDGRALYQLTVAASEHYNTTFETALTARLGVQFAPRPGAETGTQQVREIADIPTEWITHFSRRRTELEARYDELLRDYRATHGHDPSRAVAHKLARQANLDTREGKKPPRSLAAMRADWRRQIVDTFGPSGLEALARIVPDPAAASAARVTELPAEVVDQLAAAVIARVAEQRATWTRWNVHAEAERMVREQTSRTGPFATVTAQRDAVTRIVDQALSPVHSIVVDAPAVLTEPDVLRRSDGSSVFTEHGATRYTSSLILDAEQRLLHAATTPGKPGLPHGSVAAALAAFEARHSRLLDPGQRELVTAFATARTRLAVGIGAAGTGKTTAMTALRHVTDAHGRRLIPLATSAASAAVLAADVGVPAENLHKFLWEHTHGQGVHAAALREGRPVPANHRFFAVRPGDVILVDEAGMAGTLLLDRLVGIASHHGATVRLLGDWRQLGAVESGGALRLLAHDAGAVELTTLHRFVNPAEAAATTKLRTGDTTALDFYAAHDRIRGGSRQAMTDAAYAAWKTDMLAGHTTLMIAATNHDVTRLAAQARADRVAAGQVEPAGVRLRDGNLAGMGDWIVTRANDRTTTTNRGKDWVKNGDAWTVIRRHHDGSLRVRHQEHGGRVTLSADYVAAHVQLHYATTTHRAQGATVDTAHLLVDDQLTRENLYVALTRARLANHAYVATHELLPLDEDHRLDRPRHDPDARAAREVLETILGDDGAPLSATETIRDSQHRAASLATLAPRYLHAAEQATAGRYGRLIHALFDPATADQLTADPAFSAVVRAMRHGETAGWQPEQLLATAARRGPLTTADSPAQLLAWRCTNTVDEHRAPVPLAQPTADDAARYAVAVAVAALTGLNQTQLSTRRALQPPAALIVDPALAAARAADHYQAIIVGVLGPRTTIRAVNETAWPALAAAVRRAEHAGHNPTEVLRRAYAERELHTADSISEVLAWRIGRYLDRHPAATPADPASSWNRLAWTLKAAEQATSTDPATLLSGVHGQVSVDDLLRHLEASVRSHREATAANRDPLPWLAEADTVDPNYAQYLSDSRAQIATRVRDLALHAAAHRSAWTTVFGPQPADDTTRQTWLRLLGIAAAYRDQHNVTDDNPDQPLGAYIDAGRAGHTAYWKAAEAIIAAHQLARPGSAPRTVDPVAHRIAADIYAGLPAEERAHISTTMAARLGPLWLGDPTDADTAATHPIHTDQLTMVLRQRGHLADAEPDQPAPPQDTHRLLAAREAERLAQLAAHALARQDAAARPTAIDPNLVRPAPHPQPGVRQPRW